MEIEFLKYNQQEMIDKFNLKNDSDYLYINFISRTYRVNRTSGNVEWSNDGFQNPIRAGYNEAMTIFDVLCSSKRHCFLSGTFVALNSLKGTGQATSLGNDLFNDNIQPFAHRTAELAKACELLGGTKEGVGDVAYRLPLFDFLPVILQYWDADDEFSPVLKILWDENSLDFIHYESTYYAVWHLLSRINELMEQY